jgi:hypothetical protein
MKVPSWVHLFIMTILLALGCSSIARYAALYFNDVPPVRLLLTFVLFIPVMRVLYQWHRLVLEKQNAR